jgi:hypothetical protein
MQDAFSEDHSDAVEGIEVRRSGESARPARAWIGQARAARARNQQRRAIAGADIGEGHDDGDDAAMEASAVVAGGGAQAMGMTARMDLRRVAGAADHDAVAPQVQPVVIDVAPDVTDQAGLSIISSNGLPPSTALK